MIKTAGFILAITTACLLLTWSEDARAQQPAGSRDRDVSQNGDVWWRQMFSMSFDGHGNFVVPHLDKLNTTAASFGAAGFHGVWDADLNRDMPWMRGHVAEFDKHLDVRKVFYIAGGRIDAEFHHERTVRDQQRALEYGQRRQVACTARRLRSHGSSEDSHSHFFQWPGWQADLTAKVRLEELPRE
jgi:hypothetical protein